VPSARLIGYHYPYREVPDVERHLPVVGSVRNPWDYYVSWYHFQLRLPTQNVLFRVASDDGALGFESTVSNLINLTDDKHRLARLESALPEGYRPRGINLIKRDVADLRSWGGGFYSFLYQRLYAGTTGPTIVRLERLREDLRSVLETVGHLPDDCISKFLDEAPALNPSHHKGAAAHLTAPLATLVAERDHLVIKRHGYSSPSGRD